MTFLSSRHVSYTGSNSSCGNSGNSSSRSRKEEEKNTKARRKKNRERLYNEMHYAKEMK